MKPRTLALLTTLALALALPAPAADLSQITAAAATYESGQSTEPLRQIEQLLRDSAGKPALRADIEAALIKLLAPTATFEARRFACQQLNAFGTDASLPALAGMLQNDETAGIACLALSTHRSPRAREALRNALPASKGRTRLQIISALGNHQDKESVKSLSELARDADAAVANTAITALGKIGGAEARAVIAALRQENKPATASAVAEATLRIADQLAAAGNRKAAAALAEEMLASCQPVQIRRGAFGALLRLDRDGGERRITETLRGSDSLLKPVAIAGIPALKSSQASAKFAAEMAKLPPQEQALMIEALAARGDAAARAEIRAQLAAGNATVRLAAINAMGRIGDASAVPALAMTLAGAKTTEEETALTEAFAGLRGGERTDQAVIAEMEKASGRSKIVLVTVLASRGGRSAVPALLQETSGADAAVAKAAFQALGRLATAAEAGVLLDKLAGAPSPELRRDAEAAVAQVLAKITDAGRRTELLCERLGKTTDVETRCSLIRLLSVAGDAKALAAVKSACGDGDARVADTAARTLAEWRGAEAWDALLAIYQQPANEAHRVLALRGLARLAGEENAKPTPALIARYKQLLDGARSDNDRRLLLGALAGVAHPDALPLALPLLSNPAVRQEAVLAVRKIAAAIRAQHPKAAQDALQKLK